MSVRHQRRARALVSMLAVLSIFALAAAPGQAAPSSSAALKRSATLQRSSQRELASNVTAKEGGDAEGKSEIQEGANQFAEPRFGPPGALRHAFAQAAALVSGGSAARR